MSNNIIKIRRMAKKSNEHVRIFVRLYIPEDVAREQGQKFYFLTIVVK